MSEPVAQPALPLRTRPRKRRATKPLALLALTVALAAPLAMVTVDGVSRAPQAQAASAGTEPLAAAVAPQEFAVASELSGTAADERVALSATSATEIEAQRVAAEAQQAASRLTVGVDGQIAAAGATVGFAPAGDYGSAIANLASQYTGVPYVFGGSDPSGWDCSGFVKWVVQQQTGITLPHGATGQANAMYAVSASEAQPGDFWFRGSPGGYYHVAIYLGDGMIVHAVDYGIPTKIESIYGSGDFYRLG